MIRTVFHYTYWILIFLTGIFQLFGLSSGIYKLGIPLVSAGLFAYSFFTKGNQLKFPFLAWVFGFGIVAVVSSYLNQVDSFSLAYFLIYTLLSYAYFIVLINEDSNLLISRVVSFIKLLILLQVPAIIVKYLLIGQSEHGGIGTLSVNAGSVSTIFPIFIIAILFSIYLYKRKLKYLVLIACFSLIGIVGDKRAIILFIPLVLLICGVLFIKLEKRYFMKGLTNKLILLVGLCIAIFYFTARTNKTLNPENSNWGSFNVPYIVSYIERYTSSESNNKYQMKRKGALIYFINYTLEAPPNKMIFGDGAGKLIESKFNSQDGSMSSEYGVRYGGRMGFVWLLLQVGLLGTILYLCFFMRLFAYVKNRHESNPIYLSFLVLTIVFFIDTIMYSNVFLRYEYLKGLYFVILGLILLDKKYQTQYYSKLLLF